MASVGVALIGPGLVGAAFAAQLAKQASELSNKYGLNIVLQAIASSKCAAVNEHGIQLQEWQQTKDTNAISSGQGVQQLAGWVETWPSTHKVIVDCTASEDVAQMYESWAKAGIHVVTPNKKMGSGDLSRWHAFQSASRAEGTQFFCEATVGAGLPVISTLRTLLDTGDRVLRIEGVLSGTLSYIFSSYHPPANTFSQVVAEARAAGYTEPDPRDDLSGMDVARKVVILARQCGLDAQLEQLQISSLVPKGLEALPSPDDFMSRLPEHDAEMEQEAAAAAAQGQVIRYVGVVDLEAGSCQVALRRYPKDHPFAQLRGSDNMISFTTERYLHNPLIVRGPGAGAEVTAAGVLGDLVQLCRMLPCSRTLVPRT